MSTYLLLSFRFLTPWFHGRRDEGAPEWPPSPLRVFQALVAAAARAGTLEAIRPALVWLEQREAPLVVAPEVAPAATGYRLSVPHNAMDLVGRQWAAGKEGNPAAHRTMKDVLPRRLPDDRDLGVALERRVVHFAWPTSTDGRKHAESLASLAGNVVALGWGVDLVAGEGAVVDGARIARLCNGADVVWQPVGEGGVRLRVPVAGTLRDLDRRHEQFLNRTEWGTPTLHPPAPLTVFGSSGYARQDEPPRQRVAAFTLMHPNADRMRAFDTPRQGMVVAGMLRHAVRVAAESAGWAEERVRSTVLGHGDGNAPRLLLIPIPSIEWRQGEANVVTRIRRVFVVSTDPHSRDIEWARRALGGAELRDEKSRKPSALLAVASAGEKTVKRYVEEARVWTTVSPVVLPGLDDPSGFRDRLKGTCDAAEQKRLIERLTRRREGLVRKALRHAGFSDQLVFAARIETREVGFLAGVDRASRYAVPQHLKGSPRLHVRLTWPRPVPGPLCIGRGRFSGLGLFASLPDD